MVYLSVVWALSSLFWSTALSSFVWRPIGSERQFVGLRLRGTSLPRLCDHDIHKSWLWKGRFASSAETEVGDSTLWEAFSH